MYYNGALIIDKNITGQVWKIGVVSEENLERKLYGIFYEDVPKIRGKIDILVHPNMLL